MDESVYTVKVPISGMTCDACERKVSKKLLAMPGVVEVEANAKKGYAIMRVSNVPDDDAVEAVLSKAGYHIGRSPWFTPDTRVWKIFGISAVILAIVAFLISKTDIADLPGKLANPQTGGLALVLVLGLTAGISTCMAMVGGLVLAVSASHTAALQRAGISEPSLARRMRPHLAFNAGRIIGFTVLGAMLGAFGQVLSMPTGFTGLLVIVVALVMFLLGVRLTGVSPRLSAWSPTLPASIGRALGADPDNQGAKYSDVRAGLLGAATFFLPCGFTQAVQLYALSTASPVTAGIAMGLFAVGTAPGLLVLAGVPETAGSKSRDTVLRVVGVVVLGFAVINFMGGARLLGFGLPSSAPASVTQAAASGVAPAVSSNVSYANGTQTVTMTQGSHGYTPSDTVVYSGVPIKWVINGESPYDCSAFLRVPSLGVQANLNQGENVVSLPALEDGTVPFTCVMGMYSGTLTAVNTPPKQT